MKKGDDMMTESMTRNALSSHDPGDGAMNLTIDATASFTIAFTLTEPLASGTLVRVRGDKHVLFTMFRLDAMQAEQTAEPLQVVHRHSQEEMHANWFLYARLKSMAVVEVASSLPVGAVLVAQITPVHAPISAPGMEGTWHLEQIAHRQDTEGRVISAPIAVRFTGGETDRIEVQQTVDGRLIPRHLDAFGYPAVLREDDPIAEQTALGNAGGRFHVRTKQGFEAISQARPFAMDGTPIFFGDMHWHSEFSDGQQTLDASFRNARDRLGLDFAGPGDHVGDSGRFGDQPYARQAERCREFEIPGVFSVLPSCELSFRHGHVNLITESYELMGDILAQFPDKVRPAVEAQPHRFPWEAVRSLCPAGRAILSPAHPGIDSGTVTNPDDKRLVWYSINWPREVDGEVIRSVEIMREGVSSETEEMETDWPSSVARHGGSVRTALARGYRLGFSGRSDSHQGWPGRAGLTAVQATENSLPAIFKALYERRCYATSGARIVADVTLNGHPMGSEVKLAPSDSRVFRIVIHGTAPLAQVQIVSAGVIVADLPTDPAAMDFVAEWVDERPGRFLENIDYYVRARQVDGHTLWLSPFWVDLPPLADLPDRVAQGTMPQATTLRSRNHPHRVD